MLLLTGCNTSVEDDAVPSAGDIEQLENLLSQHACVRELGQWERNYRFSRKTGLFSSYSLNPDFDVIEFHLRRAGEIRIHAGRNVMAPAPAGDWPDSRPIRSIDGKYTIGSGALALAPCEPLPQT